MSHKAGHIIIESLLTVPTITTEQSTHLQEIATRDEYTVSDRIYICALTYQVADDPVANE
jgi:hypothetical protein